MAEIRIALGVMSSVISCIEMGRAVADRLDDYRRTNSPPQVMVTLSDTMPLLITIFQQVKEACDNGRLNLESQRSLSKTVGGCRRLVMALDENLRRCMSARGDPIATNSMKAIEDIQKNLETYVFLSGLL